MTMKHDVIHDVWQMNLFVALQICQNLSSFSYLVDQYSSHPEEEDLTDESEEHQEPRRLSA